ncbi:uncharacterized protein GGS25DRAFT_495715 [Hypoxylon fragiforme]|uniref:uncharacterized protein n=1 Tax=Hypoxylon fragiforme TaxID=63214 RepID=UPI0020C60D50|nr:uncharacterized protein GGS25DRAFT_495715 [Hypoxylon fragiforme]KAI2607422.1 hypothetical protein GGS25DRAFT_495715 [Hypoxylon fragiforme]
MHWGSMSQILWARLGVLRKGGATVIAIAALGISGMCRSNRFPSHILILGIPFPSLGRWRGCKEEEGMEMWIWRLQVGGWVGGWRERDVHTYIHT